MSPKGSQPDLMEVHATEFGKRVWHSAVSPTEGVLTLSSRLGRGTFRRSWQREKGGRGCRDYGGVEGGGFVIGEFQGRTEVGGAQGEKDLEGDMMQALVALDATQMMVGPGNGNTGACSPAHMGTVLDSNSIGRTSQCTVIMWAPGLWVSASGS
jgi:hypothetical protein